MNVTKVISTVVEKGIRLVKVLRYGDDDIQEKAQITAFGIDSHPVKDMSAIYARTAVRGDEVIIGYLNTNAIAELGETRIFSTDSDGAEVFALHLKNDGSAEFGGDSRHMVRYEEMETAFNQLKSDFNALVTAYNSHVHITTATVGPSPVPGIISPTASASSPSSADISGAKINEIRTL